MTTAAWIMLIGTWSVIIFFTWKFFWMVLTIPPRQDDGSDESPET